MEVKVPFYHIVNMLLTGFVFIGGCFLIFFEYVTHLLREEAFSTVWSDTATIPEIVLTVCVFAIAYEVGLIINRIGSVIVEPVLKKYKLIPFNDNYVKFYAAKEKYPIMSTLSREYALSRTGISSFLILMIFSITNAKYIYGIVFFIISLIYYLSCKKHASKIAVLMSDE